MTVAQDEIGHAHDNLIIACLTQVLQEYLYSCSLLVFHWFCNISNWSKINVFFDQLEQKWREFIKFQEMKDSVNYVH